MFIVPLHRRSGKRARHGRKMTSNLCLTSAQLVLSALPIANTAFGLRWGPQKERKLTFY